MLNSSVNNQFSYKVNAVSGTLRKSHPKSKFRVCDVSQSLFVFDETKPRTTTNSAEIVVLQIMLTGENKCIIEYVDKAHFESEGDNEKD